MREPLKRSLSSLRDVLRNSNLRLAALSWAGSTTGEGTYLVVLGLFAYEAGGPLAVGLVGLLRMAPAAAAASFGSVLADRFARERVLGAVELMRAALLAGAALAAFAGGAAEAVFALAAAHALVSGVLRPSFKSLLPSLARTPGELLAANAVSATTEGFGMLIGPVLGGVLVATAGAGVGFLVAAFCCLVASTMLAAVHVEGGALWTNTPGRSLADVLAGLRTVAGSSHPRLIVGLFAAQTFVRGALMVFVVVVTLDLLELGQSWVGLLMAALGGGAMVGALGAGGLAGRPLAGPFLLGLVLWGAPLAGIGVLPSAAVAMVAFVLIGAGNAILDVAGNTLLQRIVPDEMLGRVFGAFVGITLASVGLGSIVAPVVIGAVGTRGALLATGALLPALALLAAPRLRVIDRAAVPPERELAFVRGVPMLASLSVVAAEQVASRLVPLTVEAGEAIIREGEEGDRFYIVESGELEVRRDGRIVAERLPGDFVGEIALLREVPRTATVIARTDARVYVLGRLDFLDAVTGHSAGTTAGHAVVEERLAGLGIRD